MVMFWGDVSASLSCMSFQPVRWYCPKKHLYTSFRDLIHTFRFCPSVVLSMTYHYQLQPNFINSKS